METEKVKATGMVPLKTFVKKNCVCIVVALVMLIFGSALLFVSLTSGPNEDTIRKYDLMARAVYNQFLVAGEKYSSGITTVDSIQKFENLVVDGKQIYNIKTSWLDSSNKETMLEGLVSIENSIKLVNSSIVEMSGKISVQENEYVVQYNYEINGLGKKVILDTDRTSLFSYEYSAASDASTWTWKYEVKIYVALIRSLLFIGSLYVIYCISYWIIYILRKEKSRYKNLDKETADGKKLEIFASCFFSVLLTILVIMLAVLVFVASVTSI